jgi:predicted dehydrogenase
MTALRLAVIGVGHLGQHHARILAGLPGVRLVGVADANFDQAQAVARRHQAQAFSSFWPLLDLVDAAVIAVPTSLHHAVARAFLERGIPLLIEKPLTASLAEADELIELANRQQTTLQVGHIERFNPAYEELLRRPMQPRYIECLRAGPYTGRSTDIGAVLDIMIHDLDLVLNLVGAPCRHVEALGVSVMGGHEDLAHARLTFANGCLANLTASRVNPQQARTMRVWSPEGFAALDFAARTLTLAQPSPALRLHGLPATARATLKDDLFTRHFPMREVSCATGSDQLTCELEDFVAAVRLGRPPRVTGQAGRDALAVADAILHSIRTHQWNGSPDGPTGPTNLPTPLGPLFPLPDENAAA